MDKTTRRTLAQRMRRGHGLITTPQAEAVGVSARELSRARARGELLRVRQRTYRPPGMPAGWEDELAADIAACHRPAVASHTSALRLHRLSAPGLSIRREITVEGSARPTVSSEVVVHRTASLPPADRMTVHRLPVTTAERTTIDMAARLTPDALLVVLDEAIMSGIISRAIMLQRASALQLGRRGVRVIIEVCSADAEANFKSGLEKAGQVLLRRAGVRDMRVNAVPERAPAAGLTDVVSEVDNLIVDWDGLRFHAGPRARQRDNDKGNAAALGGYTHLRFTWRDQRSRPDHVIAMARRAIGRP